MLGVAPQLGRTFLSSEFRSGITPVVVISDKLWRRHFRADPEILGHQIVLNGAGYTVVGVMGPGFFFDRPAYQVWIPYRSDLSPAEELKHYFGSMARLGPGFSIEQAQHEVDAVTPALPQDPDREAGWRVRLEPFTEQYTGPYVRILAVLWAAVGLVLLIACANAANLLLARASERRRDFMIRVSLGASRFQVTRQVVLEALVLGIAGGMLGIALAAASIRLLAAVFPDEHLFRQMGDASLPLGALAVTV